MTQDVTGDPAAEPSEQRHQQDADDGEVLVVVGAAGEQCAVEGVGGRGDQVDVVKLPDARPAREPVHARQRAASTGSISACPVRLDVMTAGGAIACRKPALVAGWSSHHRLYAPKAASSSSHQIGAELPAKRTDDAPDHDDEDESLEDPRQAVRPGPQPPPAPGDDQREHADRGVQRFHRRTRRDSGAGRPCCPRRTSRTSTPGGSGRSRGRPASRP